MRLRWLCSINLFGEAVLVQDFALVQFERLHDPDPSNGELRDTEAALQIIVLCPPTFPDALIGLRHILKNFWLSRQPVPFAASDARHTDFALQFSRTIACTSRAAPAARPADSTDPALSRTITRQHPPTRRREHRRLTRVRCGRQTHRSLSPDTPKMCPRAAGAAPQPVRADPARPRTLTGPSSGCALPGCGHQRR